MKKYLLLLILLITLFIKTNGDFIISGENNPDEDLIYPKKNLLQCRAEKKDHFDYLLTNENGKLLVKITSPFSEIKITKNYIITRSLTEDEETGIFVMNRHGSEEKDLAELNKINI